MAEDKAPYRTGLIDFISNTDATQFVIPVYQRIYTWTAKREVKQYLKDLANVLNKNVPRHFMGIMIYYGTDIAYDHEFSIIDGQQRLTTTFLLLLSMRNSLLEKGTEDSISEANFINEHYLQSRCHNPNLKDKLKPSVNVNDDKVYQKIIDREVDKIDKDSIETKSNVYVNYYHLKKWVEEITKEGNISYVDIIHAINKLYMVVIPLFSTDNPQKIFESINSTGIKLTASDLIRNYILMTLPSETQESYYNNYWKQIEFNFACDAKKMEEFFRFFLASMNYSLCKKDQTYEEFRDWYDKQIEQKIPSEIILSKIKNYANYFNIIKYSNEIHEKILKDAIVEFRKNNTDVPSPYIMEMFHLYYEKQITLEQLVKMIRVISTYWIRRELLSLDTKPLSRIFPSLIKTVYNACDGNYEEIDTVFIKYLITMNQGKSASMPNDDLLTEHLKHDDLYIKRDCLRIILDRLENEGNSAPVPTDLLSVEHLMPQDGTKWFDKLKCSEFEYNANLHRLGNLTLVSASDNSKAQNNIWEKKKELFATTDHLKLNKEILKVKDWNLKEIEKRTNKLIPEILSLYPYYTVKLEGVQTIDIHISNTNKKFTANAIFDLQTGNVQILKDSAIMDYSKEHDFTDFDELFQKLCEEETLKQTDNGFVFAEDYVFEAQRKNETALSSAAGFILQGSRNGKEYWLDETESKLKENPYFIASKFGKQNNEK